MSWQCDSVSWQCDSVLTVWQCVLYSLDGQKKPLTVVTSCCGGQHHRSGCVTASCLEMPHRGDFLTSGAEIILIKSLDQQSRPFYRFCRWQWPFKKGFDRSTCSSRQIHMQLLPNQYSASDKSWVGIGHLEIQDSTTPWQRRRGSRRKTSFIIVLMVLNITYDSFSFFHPVVFECSDPSLLSDFLTWIMPGLAGSPGSTRSVQLVSTYDHVSLHHPFYVFLWK